MTHFLALMNVFAATSTKKSSSSVVPLLILVVIAVAGYFFFLKPQQAKARAARANTGSGYEVGDEVQTIGGVVGTILEIHGDRYTLLTGSMGSDGNLNGAQPTRIVFVRQAIARKLEPVVEADPIDHVDVDVDSDHDYHHDSVEVDDHDEEAEEA
jgi:preprotein translocase YajC subunit